MKTMTTNGVFRLNRDHPNQNMFCQKNIKSILSDNHKKKIHVFSQQAWRSNYHMSITIIWIPRNRNFQARRSNLHEKNQKKNYVKDTLLLVGWRRLYRKLLFVPPSW
jgi:hypothetical protein